MFFKENFFSLLRLYNITKPDYIKEIHKYTLHDSKMFTVV